MKKSITILGAGITGASLGCFLSRRGHDVNIVEKTTTVGGMAKSFKYKKYTLDYGPHKLYSQIPGIIDEYKSICKSNIRIVEKHNSIFIRGKPFSFPVNMVQLSLGINPVVSMRLGVGFILAQIKMLFGKKKTSTYEDYFIAGFGRPAYELLFKELALKVWGNPKNLSSELSQRRVPVPSILELLKSGSGKDSGGNELSAKHFYYPKKGGCGYVTESYIKQMEYNHGTVDFSSQVIEVKTENNLVKELKIKTNDKIRTINPDFLASSIYLKDLLSCMNPKPPKNVVNAVNSLKYRSLIIVYIFVNKTKVFKDNWIFFPEKKYIFNRLADLNSFSPDIGPKGHSVITAEITCESDDDIYSSDDGYIFRRVMDDISKTGLFDESIVEDFLIKKAGRIYPVYDIHYRKNLGVVLGYLDRFKNMITIGRQGLYNYNNTDHCIDMSLKADEYISEYFEASNDPDGWKKLREYFDSYRIVD